MNCLPFCMISDLKLAELNAFGNLTLQSIGEFLDIEGYEDMTNAMLIEAIEDLVRERSFVINNSSVVADLVLPY